MLSDQTLLIQPPFIYCGLLKLIFLSNFLLLLKAHSILNSVKYKLFYQFPVNVRILQKTLTPFTTSSFILFLSCVNFYIFQTRYIISCFVQSLVFSIYSLIYTFFFFFQQFSVSYWNHFPENLLLVIFQKNFAVEEFCFCFSEIVFIYLHFGVIFLQGTEFWWAAIFFDRLKVDFPLYS